jgi:hypothetical protein
MPTCSCKNPLTILGGILCLLLKDGREIRSACTCRCKNPLTIEE